MINKELKDWTFDELVAYNRGCIVIGIGEGKFQYEVWAATNLTVQWCKAQQDKKEAEKAKKP